MSTILQNMMGMLWRKQQVVPKTDDYITIARYQNPQERMKPQPKVQTELVTMKALKTFVNTGGGAVSSIIGGTNVSVSSATGNVTVSAPDAIVNTTDTYGEEKVTNVISLTQDQYDNDIGTPNVNTLYIIIG
jgi:hypothetical protein